MAGSAIQAFEEVCPERVDLVHKNYRKLCNLLVDVEEWGQVGERWKIWRNEWRLMFKLDYKWLTLIGG